MGYPPGAGPTCGGYKGVPFAPAPTPGPKNPAHIDISSVSPRGVSRAGLGAKRPQTARNARAKKVGIFAREHFDAKYLGRKGVALYSSCEEIRGAMGSPFWEGFRGASAGVWAVSPVSLWVARASLYLARIHRRMHTEHTDKMQLLEGGDKVTSLDSMALLMELDGAAEFCASVPCSQSGESHPVFHHVPSKVRGQRQPPRNIIESQMLFYIHWVTTPLGASSDNWFLDQFSLGKPTHAASLGLRLF